LLVLNHIRIEVSCWKWELKTTETSVLISSYNYCLDCIIIYIVVGQVVFHTNALNQTACRNVGNMIVVLHVLCWNMNIHSTLTSMPQSYVKT